MHRSKFVFLLDQFGGGGKQSPRNGEAQGLRGFEVDDQIEFGGLHDRQVGRFFTLEDLADVSASLAIGIRKVGSVAHQTAGCGEVPQIMDRGNRMACCERDEWIASAYEKRISIDNKRVGSLLNQGCEGRVDVIFGTGA